MKTKTVLSNIVVAAGGALLITMVWMAGLAALTNANVARAGEANRAAIVRLETMVVTAKRLAPPVEHMKTITVTAPRLSAEQFAALEQQDARTTPVSHAAPATRSAETRI